MVDHKKLVITIPTIGPETAPAEVLGILKEIQEVVKTMENGRPLVRLVNLACGMPDNFGAQSFSVATILQSDIFRRPEDEGFGYLGGSPEDSQATCWNDLSLESKTLDRELYPHLVRAVKGNAANFVKRVRNESYIEAMTVLFQGESMSASSDIMETWQKLLVLKWKGCGTSNEWYSKMLGIVFDT